MDENYMTLLENEIKRQLNVIILATQKVEDNHGLEPDISEIQILLGDKLESYFKLVNELNK